LRRFFFRGEDKLLNKTNLLWAKDDQGKCFSVLLNLKIFLEPTDLSVLGFLQVVDRKNYLLLNDWGEIDCYGDTWQGLFGLTYEKNLLAGQGGPIGVSFFLFCPKLIPLFLGKFYGVEGFKLEGFDYGRFERFCFFVPGIDGESLGCLGEKLAKIKLRDSHKEERSDDGEGGPCEEVLRDYCYELYSFLSSLTHKSYKTYHKVHVEMALKCFAGRAKVYELKIVKVEKKFGQAVGKKIYGRETAFVKKLCYDCNLKKTLDLIKNVGNKGDSGKGLISSSGKLTEMLSNFGKSENLKRKDSIAEGVRPLVSISRNDSNLNKRSLSESVMTCCLGQNSLLDGGAGSVETDTHLGPSK
jgi:hypothetical protein